MAVISKVEMRAAVGALLGSWGVAATCGATAAAEEKGAESVEDQRRAAVLAISRCVAKLSVKRCMAAWGGVVMKECVVVVNTEDVTSNKGQVGNTASHVWIETKGSHTKIQCARTREDEEK